MRGRGAVACGLFLLPIAAQDVPVPRGVDVATWKKLDLEGRWVLYRQTVREQKEATAVWVAFLEKRRDFELLEYLAIYEGFQQLFTKGQPGEALYRLDAPQWMRVALWNINQRDTHNVQASTSPLQKHPGRFVGWAKKHPEVKRLGGKALLDKLSGVTAEDPGEQLPPLDPTTVILPFLDAPKKLAILEVDARFDRRKRYQHQVLRAVRAVSVAAVFGEPYRGKLLRLTRHPDLAVRRAAMLEFSQFPKAQVPHAELLALAKDPKGAPQDRRIALLAASYSDHPSVYLHLHAALRDPKDPGHGAAVDRMGAFGDGYTEHVLRTMSRDALSHAQGQRLIGAELALKRRLLPKQPHQPPAIPNAGLLLARAGWAEKTKDPQAEALVNYTRKYLGRIAKLQQVRAALQQIVADPGKSGVPATLHDRVREAARKLLRGRK